MRPRLLWPSAKVRFAADEFAEDVCGGGQVVVLAEDEAELDARVGVFRIERDGFVEFGDGLLRLAGLGEGEAEIVVSFGEIGIGEDGLMEFFDGVLLIALAPAEEAEARMDLSVIGLEFESFRVGWLGLERRRLFALASGRGSSSWWEGKAPL